MSCKDSFDKDVLKIALSQDENQLVFLRELAARDRAAAIIGAGNSDLSQVTEQSTAARMALSLFEELDSIGGLKKAKEMERLLMDRSSIIRSPHEDIPTILTDHARSYAHDIIGQMQKQLEFSKMKDVHSKEPAHLDDNAIDGSYEQPPVRPLRPC